MVCFNLHYISLKKNALLIGILTTLSLPAKLASQISTYWGKGSMVISCSPTTFDSTAGTYEDGHVIGIIDVRKSCDFSKLAIWPDTGEVYPNKFYYQSGNEWKFSNLGMVFPLATDENGNIYVGGTSTYGSVAFPDGVFPNGQRGSGSIHKIDATTGFVNTNFVNTRQTTSFNPLFPKSMPNKTITTDIWGINLEYNAKSGPGLGDLTYNSYHKFLYASNFEDGKIYKIDPGTGNIVNIFDPRFGDNSSNGLDNNADGFAARGQRPWALGINKENNVTKLYYSNWRVDIRDTFPEPGTIYNDIWSVELDLVGNPLPLTEKLEITIPHLSLNHPERPFQYSSNPVSDMAFSDNGEMYLSERAMDHEYGRYIGIVWDTTTGQLIPNPRNIANHARVLRYNRLGSIWSLHNGNDKFYELGHDVTSQRSVNASGGICIGDFSCPGKYSKNSMVYATGDFDDVKTDAFVYGVLGMDNNIGDFNNHIYLDFDSFVAIGGTSPKTTPGDAEIWAGLKNLNLACDDHINVSLDTNCCVTITPDMVLEGNYPLNCVIVILKDQYGRPILGSPTVCNAFIGQTLQYEVLDTCTKNRCWGTLHIEDKLPPKINCQNPDTVFCNNTGFNWTPPVGVDNCGGVVKTIVISDVTTKMPCDSFCIAQRKVTYYYQDQYGNRSDTCMKIICYKKINFSDIVWPRDTVFSCEAWDTIPPPSTSGVPMAGGYPIYPDWHLCKMAVTYEDLLIPICPKSFKVLRTWTVIDWCKSSPNNVYKYYQVIKVIDDRGPIVVCAPNLTVSTDIWSCTGTAIIAPPRVIRECSKTTLEVGYKIVDKLGVPTYEGTSKNNIIKLPNGFYSISGLPLGLSWVVFHVTDECGNSTDCYTEVTVADIVPPIAVCDQKTVVSLTIDGTAKIEAITFDDGSLDNCMIDRFEVKRMDDGIKCNIINGNQWGPYVFFCCADIGKTIMVSLRVWDKAGNSNTCMVEVQVQDKIPPIIFCPPHITVSCEFDYADLSAFGTVVPDFNLRKPIQINDPKVKHSGPLLDGYAYDGCGVVVKELTPIYNLTCNKGTITRTFEATDISGLKSICTQIIMIQDLNPNNVTVRWPADFLSSSNCTAVPKLQPDVTGKPIVSGADKCNQIMVTFEDQLFTLEPDACIKILRKWTIIDWCIYQANNPTTGGYWTWTQIIKVSNTVAPTFTSSCADRNIDVYGPGCSGNISLVGTAKDDCTDSADLVWYHSVDLYNDGLSPGIEYLRSGPGADASGTYPVGKHRITYFVKDGCNNESRCSFVITVVDAKKPTPYCNGSITTTIMPSTKAISIWAKDFNINSEDNCTSKENLKYYFLINNIKFPSLNLDCSNIGLNKIRMYVEDEAGNSDYCEVTLDLQDPNKVCGGTFLRASGNMTTPDGRVMPKGKLTAINSNTGSSQEIEVQANGNYSFNDLTKGGSYRIKSTYNEDPLNGVSTQDIVLIQKHILGQQLLDSPYKYIAADANNSGSISAADISEIRKLILGIIPKFNQNESWRFIPKGYVFQNKNKPFPFEEEILHQNITTNCLNDDFYAVKIGDINGNVILFNAT
ncbi:MAG: HYR domain-containing protein, partial [Saprospiraceae bacterium]|nr:HYR domain-containing protein [Saprospiraceae bacterium]